MMFVFTGAVFDCNFQEPLIKQEHPEIAQTPFDPYAWLHFAAHPLSKTAVPIYLQTVLVNGTENGIMPPEKNFVIHRLHYSHLSLQVKFRSFIPPTSKILMVIDVGSGDIALNLKIPLR